MTDDAVNTTPTEHEYGLPDVLQTLYNKEINIAITTMWDGGYELTIGGCPGYTKELEYGNVYGADNIAAWFVDAYERNYSAQAIEARRSETLGSVHESAVPTGCAQSQPSDQSPPSPNMGDTK